MSLSTQETIDQLKNWCTNDVAGFDISSQILSKLVKAGRVKSVLDIYRLTVRDFANLNKIKPVQAGSIVANVQKHNEMTLSSVIAGLQIPGIGAEEAEVLADKHQTLDTFITKCLDPLNDKAFKKFLDGEGLMDLDKWFKKGGEDFVQQVFSLTTGSTPIVSVKDFGEEANVVEVVEEKVKAASPTSKVKPKVTPVKAKDKPKTEKKSTNKPAGKDKVSYAVKGKKFFIRGRFKGLTQAAIVERLEFKGGDVVLNEEFADTFLLGTSHGVANKELKGSRVFTEGVEGPKGTEAFFKRIGDLY